MGIEIPDELQWVAKWVVGAGDWPEADETAIRRIADAWNGMATALEESSGDANHTMQAALTALHSGESHTALSAHWDMVGGKDDAALPKLIEHCRWLADQADDGALDIEHTKLAIITAMVLLAAELVVAGVTAWTGVGAVAGAAARVATQAGIRIAIQMLIKRLATVVGKGALFGVLEGGAGELIPHLIQFASGERTGLDGENVQGLVGSVISGAVGGAVGGGLGSGGLAAPLTNQVGSTVGKTVTELGVESAAGVAGNVAGTVAVGGELTLETFTSGAAGGAAERGASAAGEAAGTHFGQDAPSVPETGSPADTDPSSPASTPSESGAPAQPDNGAPGEQAATQPAATGADPDTGSTPSSESPNSAPQNDSASTTSASPASTPESTPTPTDSGSAPESAGQAPTPDSQDAPGDTSTPSSPDSPASTTDSTSPGSSPNSSPDTPGTAPDVPGTAADRPDPPTSDSPPPGSSPDLSPDPPGTTPNTSDTPQTVLPDGTVPGSSLNLPPDPPSPTPATSDAPSAPTTGDTSTPHTSGTTTSPDNPAGTSAAATTTTTGTPATSTPSSTTPVSGTSTSQSTEGSHRPNTAAPTAETGPAGAPRTTTDPTRGTPPSRAPEAPSAGPPRPARGDLERPGHPADRPAHRLEPPREAAGLNPFRRSRPTPAPDAGRSRPYGDSDISRPGDHSWGAPPPHRPPNSGTPARSAEPVEPVAPRPTDDSHTPGTRNESAPLESHPPDRRALTPHELADRANRSSMAKAMYNYMQETNLTFDEVQRAVRAGDLLIDPNWEIFPRPRIEVVDALPPPDNFDEAYLNAVLEHHYSHNRRVSPYDSMADPTFEPGCPDNELPAHITRDMPADALADAVDPVADNLFLNREGDDAVVWRDRSAGDAFLRQENALFRMESRGPAEIGGLGGFHCRRPGDPNLGAHTGQATNGGGCVSFSNSPEHVLQREDSLSVDMHGVEQLPNGLYRQTRYMYEAYHPFGVDVESSHRDTGNPSGHREAEVLAPGGLSSDVIYRVWTREIVFDPDNWNQIVSARVLPPIYNPNFRYSDHPNFTSPDNSSAPPTNPAPAPPQPATTPDSDPGRAPVNEPPSNPYRAPDSNNEQPPRRFATDPLPGDPIWDPADIANLLGRDSAESNPALPPQSRATPEPAQRDSAGRTDTDPRTYRFPQGQPAPALHQAPATNTVIPEFPAARTDNATNPGPARAPESVPPAPVPHAPENGSAQPPAPRGETRTHPDHQAPPNAPAPRSTEASPGLRTPTPGTPAVQPGNGGVASPHGNAPVAAPHRTPEGLAPHPGHRAPEGNSPVRADRPQTPGPARPQDGRSPVGDGRRTDTPAATAPRPQNPPNPTRVFREDCRQLPPVQGRVTPVAPAARPRSGPAYSVRHVDIAGNPPQRITVATIAVHVSAPPDVPRADVHRVMESVQTTVDSAFNRGHELPGGERILLDIVYTSDPAAANIRVSVDPRQNGPSIWNPHHADPGTLAGFVRDQLGIGPSRPGDPGLNTADLRVIGNDIATANTRAPFADPSQGRVFADGYLRPVERPEYQAAVEDALRNGDHFQMFADPRTNPYFSRINDGGTSVPGRNNNCVESCMALLSSFFGRPLVAAPCWRAEQPDAYGRVTAGEADSLRRAAAWLGQDLRSGFDLGSTINEQFRGLHDQVARLGPGAAAFVVNQWHARDPATREFQYSPDGRPVTDGNHAIAIVYPLGADGPVWVDPQGNRLAEGPPHDLIADSAGLWFNVIPSPIGVPDAGTVRDRGTGENPSGTDPRTRPGVPDLPDRSRVGVLPDTDPARNLDPTGRRDAETGNRRGERSDLRVPELVARNDHQQLPHLQGGGQPTPGRTDLPQAAAAAPRVDPGTTPNSPSRPPGASPEGMGGRPDSRVLGELRQPVPGRQRIPPGDQQADPRRPAPGIPARRPDTGTGGGVDHAVPPHQPGGMARPGEFRPLGPTPPTTAGAGRDTDPPSDREPCFRMLDAEAPEIRDLVDLQRAARRAAQVGWRTMGGALEFRIGDLSGAFAGFSGTRDVTRNVASGETAPPTAPPSTLNRIVPDIPDDDLRENDAENNMLEHLLRDIQEEYPPDNNGINRINGHVRLFSEQQPCNSCEPTIRAFQDMYPGLQVDVYYTLPYPPVRRDRPTL